MKRFKISALLFSISLVATGCGQKVNFGGEESSSSVKTDIQPPTPIEPCKPGETISYKPIKFIIVVDQSGSNLTGSVLGGSGTDPKKKLRYGAMDSFLKQHGKKSNVEWSVISFANKSAIALTRKGRDISTPVFTDEAGMYAALGEFEAKDDGGTTPYIPALEMVRNLIRKDIQSSNGKAQYRIAFLTDGYPTDYSSASTMNYELSKSMNSLMSVSERSIQLSTVYYGAPDQSAAKRLKTMADEGNGVFVNATNAKSFKLDDAIRVPKPTCQ